jgi:pimeloyl-ACP methyl ester carboxylesterase
MSTRKMSLLFFLLSFLVTAVLCPVTGWTQAATATPYTGKLSDGLTDYNLLVPTNWNGTLLASLDTMGGGDVRNWLLDGGYALAGTARGPASWNLTYAATNIIEAMDKFEALVGKPSRTIIWGKSRGGITARAALQLFPERFDGAIPMCGGGAGTVAMWNFKLDATFALDVLLGTQYGLRLQLNNIKDLATETTRINQIVTQAQQTPEGRARIAMAGAFAQIAIWNSPSQPEPAKYDYEAQEVNIASQIAFALGTSFVPFLEGLAGGPFTWNHGIDYREQLARSGYEKMVRALYKKAGLNIDADLKKLAKAPRIYADPDAVSFIEKHNMTWTGEIRQPVFDVTTTGDPAGPISDEKSYADIVRYAGNNKLLRHAFVHNGGHCNFTTGEQIAVFETMFRRLNTGKWENCSGLLKHCDKCDKGKWGDSTKAHELNKLVEELQMETSVNLGGSNFVQIALPNAMRTWDVRNWDTYSPTMDQCKHKR